MFWVAGHAGLVFRIGGEAALPRRQELAQRGRRPRYVRSRDSASVALLWGCGSVVSRGRAGFVCASTTPYVRGAFGQSFVTGGYSPVSFASRRSTVLRPSRASRVSLYLYDPAVLRCSRC